MAQIINASLVSFYTVSDEREARVRHVDETERRGFGGGASAAALPGIG